MSFSGFYSRHCEVAVEGRGDLTTKRDLEYLKFIVIHGKRAYTAYQALGRVHTCSPNRRVSLKSYDLCWFPSCPSSFIMSSDIKPTAPARPSAEVKEANPSNITESALPTLHLYHPSSSKMSLHSVRGKDEDIELSNRVANPPSDSADVRVVEGPASEDQSSGLPSPNAKGMRTIAYVQFAALCWTLFLAGWNDGSTGPLLPRFRSVYDVRNICFPLFAMMCRADPR